MIMKSFPAIARLIGRTALLLLMTAAATGAAVTAFAGETMRIIIDTDPGMGYLFRDIDDGLMLVAALGSPDIEIVGITTTFGNVSLPHATASALDIVRTLGRNDVPVIPGAASAADRGSENAAARFIAETVTAAPGTITILATGPLTNIAAALMLDPAVAESVAGIIAVGGLLESDDLAELSAPYDLNFGSDPEAVRVVLGSAADVTLIHIALCLHFATTNAQFSALLDSTGSLAGYLKRKTRSWRLIKSGNFVLWDVVALNYLQHPEWYDSELTGVQINVTPGSRPSVTLRSEETTGRQVRLPMAMADLDAYWLWLADQLEQAGRSADMR
jgi:inosine-uridine nucleoside N-ribohydrolase